MVRKPTVIRHSELLHCLVIDRLTTDDRGRIELLWMYPQVHRVLGFICKIGLMRQQRWAFTLPHIKAIQGKTVWVEGEPTVAESKQLGQLETLLYHEVWSESGVFLGKVKDCLFELKTGKITQYLVALKGWRSVWNELYPLAPSDVLSFGKKRLLISDRAATTLENQRDRIQQTLAGLRQDYQSIKEDVIHFSQRAQTLTQETVQKTVAKTVRTVKDTVKDLGEQLSEQFNDLGEHLEEQWLEDNPASPAGQETIDRPSPQPQQPAPSVPPAENRAVTSAWVEQIKAESEQWPDEDWDDEDEFDGSIPPGESIPASKLPHDADDFREDTNPSDPEVIPSDRPSTPATEPTSTPPPRSTVDPPEVWDDWD